MATEPTESRTSLHPRRSPWPRLLRAFGVALDTNKLILAALGLVLMAAGWGALDRLFPSSSDLTPRVVPEVPLAFGVKTPAPAPAPATSTYTLIGPVNWEEWHADQIPGWLGQVVTIAARRVAAPARSLVAPFLGIFDSGLTSSWSRASRPYAFWHATLAALWGVVVWGIIGGAIARIAVVQVALGERIGLRQALTFAVRKAVPLVGAPLTPFLGVACFAALCALMGLLYQIPFAAVHAVLGALLILPLLAGLVMAIILLGLAVGWPLMHATVAAEGEDGFDALSRSYAYVYQRPGRYALYTLAAWALGTVGLLLVIAFARAAIGLSYWALAIGAPDSVLHTLLTVNTDRFDSTHAAWIGVVGLVTYGWVYSYFWSAASIIYLLLRQDVDGTEWEDILPAAPDPAPIAAAPRVEPEPVPAPEPTTTEPAPAPAPPPAPEAVVVETTAIEPASIEPVPLDPVEPPAPAPPNRGEPTGG